MLKTKWFIYTVLVGLIPILTRLLIYVVASSGNDALLWSEQDFIAFGLVLNITNINALEHWEDHDQGWKTRTVGFSLLFIVAFAVLFALSCVQVLSTLLVDVARLKQASAILSCASFVFSYAVSDRLNKLHSSGRTI